MEVIIGYDLTLKSKRLNEIMRNHKIESFEVGICLGTSNVHDTNLDISFYSGAKDLNVESDVFYQISHTQHNIVKKANQLLDRLVDEINEELQEYSSEKIKQTDIDYFSLSIEQESWLEYDPNELDDCYLSSIQNVDIEYSDDTLNINSNWEILFQPTQSYVEIMNNQFKVSTYGFYWTFDYLIDDYINLVNTYEPMIFQKNSILVHSNSDIFFISNKKIFDKVDNYRFKNMREELERKYEYIGAEYPNHSPKTIIKDHAFSSDSNKKFSLNLYVDSNVEISEEAIDFDKFDVYFNCFEENETVNKIVKTNNAFKRYVDEEFVYSAILKHVK